LHLIPRVELHHTIPKFWSIISEMLLILRDSKL